MISAFLEEKDVCFFTQFTFICHLGLLLKAIDSITADTVMLMEDHCLSMWKNFDFDIVYV